MACVAESSKDRDKKYRQARHASELLAHWYVATAGVRILVDQEWPRLGGAPKFVAGLLYHRS